MSTEKLDAYVYHKRHGKKGGNNVSSMIYQYLECHNMIPKNGKKAKEKKNKLSIVMDNCAGQNKVSNDMKSFIHISKCSLIFFPIELNNIVSWFAAC